MKTLDHFFQALDASHMHQSVRIPPKQEVERLADAIFYFLFPALTEEANPARVQHTIIRHQLVKILYAPLQETGLQATAVADAFFHELPEVYGYLQDDAKAILNFDPAATCMEEVIATYPGFLAIANYRIANLLHRIGVPFLPRMITEYIHGKTGIDIHPGATIGRSFFIDHGTGVVIGATSIIGNNVKIYQGVTLGALQVDKSLARVKRHPTIEDNCILYANATILGGRTIIGQDSVIGGNAWITESVPANSMVFHQTSIKVRSKPFDEPVNFVI